MADVVVEAWLASKGYDPTKAIPAEAIRELLDERDQLKTRLEPLEGDLAAFEERLVQRLLEGLGAILQDAGLVSRAKGRVE